MAKLTLSQLSNLLFRACVDLRSNDEQLANAGRLTKLEEAIRWTTTTIEELRQQKQGLVNDLLTGRVRVKLDKK
jgi:restriction endonuclease S subunit